MGMIAKSKDTHYNNYQVVIKLVNRNPIPLGIPKKKQKVNQFDFFFVFVKIS